jgi:N,N'-diacetyllegionaminate synthase
VSTTDKVFIIAEIGVNHNGSLDLAYQLIDEAVKAGTDAVKFQTSRVENVVSRYAPKADYQKKATGSDESQFDMIKKLKLNYDDHPKLIDYCRAKNTLFLSSPFDMESIDSLDRWGLDILKIPSGEITHFSYLRKIGALNKKLILSTGMSNMLEVKQAFDILMQAGTDKENITILHCNTEYPTPFEDVNLKAMLTIQKELGVKVGYSDHTLGIEISIAAVALGATVIEKHITLNRDMEGPDHKASLEPGEFSAMAEGIRNIEKAIGDGIKRCSPSEEGNKTIARKSIVAARDIEKGETFSEVNLAVKRPGNGISPMRWDEIIGQTAKRDFVADEMIKE